MHLSAPAKIVTPPKSVVAKLDSSVEFYVLATGWPRPDVVWLHNDERINVDDGAGDFGVETAECADGNELAVESLLVVRRVTRATAGRFTVKVANEWDVERRDAQLTGLD